MSKTLDDYREEVLVRLFCEKWSYVYGTARHQHAADDRRNARKLQATDPEAYSSHTSRIIFWHVDEQLRPLCIVNCLDNSRPHAHCRQNSCQSRRALQTWQTS